MRRARIARPLISARLSLLSPKVRFKESLCPRSDPITASNAIALLDFGRQSARYSEVIQAFHRFLLDHMSNEGNSYPYNPLIVLSTSPSVPMALSPLTQLLGINSKNYIVCTSCKATREKENIVHVVDMHYPRPVCALIRHSI